MLVAADTAERLVLAPLAKRAARARARMPTDARLFDMLSESQVASAILEGTPVDLAPAVREAAARNFASIHCAFSASADVPVIRPQN